MTNLQDARLDNGGFLVILDLATAAASSLKSPDNIHGLLVSNLAEDDVLAIEPAGYHSGNEELRAVAIGTSCQGVFQNNVCACLRVGTSIGHREKSWLGVLAGEVLIRELLTVDGLATSALCHCKFPSLEL